MSELNNPLIDSKRRGTNKSYVAFGECNYYDPLDYEIMTDLDSLISRMEDIHSKIKDQTEEEFTNDYDVFFDEMLELSRSVSSYASSLDIRKEEETIETVYVNIKELVNYMYGNYGVDFEELRKDSIDGLVKSIELLKSLT